jgi:hypothetical protein
MGQRGDLRKDADVLDGSRRRSSRSTAKAGEKDWATLLADDTWMTAEQAVELGLADRVAVIPDAGETGDRRRGRRSRRDRPDRDDDDEPDDSARRHFGISALRGPRSDHPQAPELNRAGGTQQKRTPRWRTTPWRLAFASGSV